MKNFSISKRARGAGLVKSLLLTIPLLFLVWLGFVEARKAYLDYQVRELCAKDGGVKVYEKVKLPAEKFNEYGNVTIPVKADVKPNDPYYYEWDVTYIRTGNPELYRDRYRIFRSLDGKLLGEAIGYARRGGDMPSPSHDSSYRCPSLEKDQPGLDALVFLKGDKQ